MLCLTLSPEECSCFCCCCVLICSQCADSCPYSYLPQVVTLSQILSTLRHTGKKFILCAVSKKVVRKNDQTNSFSPQGEADSCGYCPFTLWVKGRSYGVYQLKILFSSRQPDCSGPICTLRWASCMPFLCTTPEKLGPQMYIATSPPHLQLGWGGGNGIFNSLILTNWREGLCNLPPQATVSLFSLRKLVFVKLIRDPRLKSSKKPVLWGVPLKKLRYWMHKPTPSHLGRSWELRDLSDGRTNTI